MAARNYKDPPLVIYEADEIRGGNIPMILDDRNTEVATFSKQRYKDFKTDDKSATLSASCFDFGSGGGKP